MQIAIVLYPGVTALDAIGPYEVLRMNPDAEIRFVSGAPSPFMTDSGVLVLNATHLFEARPSPDMVLVPGSATNTGRAMADQALIGWLQRTHATSLWTASVCSGALIPGPAGILNGHPATTHWMAQDLLASFGATTQREQRIVRSGKIVTAAGVSAGIDLGLWLVGEMCGPERAEIVQLLIEYDPRPPFNAGHPSKASKKVFEIARAEMLNLSKNPLQGIQSPPMRYSKCLRLS
jgi:transcriptional regulator GlxA family with amidase domain